MGLPQYHVYRLNLIAAYFKLHCLPGIYIPLPDQAMTHYYNEQFQLAVMPVLPFGKPLLADIDRELTTVFGF